MHGWGSIVLYDSMTLGCSIEGVLFRAVGHMDLVGRILYRDGAPAYSEGTCKCRRRGGRFTLEDRQLEHQHPPTPKPGEEEEEEGKPAQIKL